MNIEFNRYRVDDVLQVYGRRTHELPMVSLELEWFESLRHVLLRRRSSERTNNSERALALEALHKGGVRKLASKDALEEACAISELQEDDLLLIADVVGPC